MRNFFLKNTKQILVGLLLINILLFVYTIQNYITNKKADMALQNNAQEMLICPTDTSAKNSLQLHNCYMIPKAVNPTISGQDTGCSNQITDYTTLKQLLLSKYKLDIRGDQDITWVNQAYATMCLLSKSNKFMTLLTTQAPVIVKFTATSCDLLSGHADMSTGITISGMCDPQLNRAALVHEFGHTIIFRNPSLFNNFLNSIWPAHIPTYNCQVFNIDAVTSPECFADGASEYVTYTYFRMAFSGIPPGPANFPDFPTTYANYYNFFKDNVFGGITFTGF